MKDVGLVIGTLGSPAYIHLQLEAARKWYPEVPILVHDDSSPSWRHLAALARQYGADLMVSPTRAPQQPPGLGDLTAFVQGLIWAQTRGLDLLVKFSRRWVVCRPWVQQLREIAQRTDYSTYSSYCTSYGFGFRTECLAMEVQPWFSSAFIDDAKSRITNKDLPLPEHYIHQHAIRIHDSRPRKEFQPRDNPFGGALVGYGLWSEMLGTDRRGRRDRQMWHDTDSPAVYASTARTLGLDLTTGDFERLD